jgi:hypothetical protein
MPLFTFVVTVSAQDAEESLTALAVLADSGSLPVFAELVSGEDHVDPIGGVWVSGSSGGFDDQDLVDCLLDDVSGVSLP